MKLDLTLAQGDYVGVLALRDRCEPFMTRENNCTVALSRARALAKLGRYTEAQAACEQALEQEPEATWLLLERAALFHEMGCPDLALADIEQLLAEKPDDSNYREFKAMFLLGAKRYAAAISLYESLLQNEAIPDSERVRLLSSKGHTLRKQEDYDAALAQYEQALAIQPDDRQALVKRGELRAALGQQELALADLDRARALESQNPDSQSLALWRVCATALYELGLYEQALESCEQGLQSETNLNLLLDKARCHLALDHSAQAREALQTAQALDADTTDLLVAEKPELAELGQSPRTEAVA